MSRLKVRQIPFRFDEQTPYYWNLHNPWWGNEVIFLSVVAPAFERYFIKAIRAAIPRIKDPSLIEDAELFCRQEAQHSKQHLAHLRALISQYPEIESVRRQVVDSYDELFERESIEYHLAYAASLELLFGPIAKFMVDNRNYLFRDCDNQVAALILWHFVEEFEHRNSAIDVYNHLVGSYSWRIRKVPEFSAHLMNIRRIFSRSMSRCVPNLTWQGISVRAGELGLKLYRDIPLVNILVYLRNLLYSQLPLHNPNRLEQPAWVSRWIEDEAAGKDMTRYVP